jgi:hypothetical protein
MDDNVVEADRHADWFAVPHESAGATRDHRTGQVTVPLALHTGQGPLVRVPLRLDAIRAELLHARLSRLLQGEPPLEPFGPSAAEAAGQSAPPSRRDQLDL